MSSKINKQKNPDSTVNLSSVLLIHGHLNKMPVTNLS